MKKSARNVPKKAAPKKAAPRRPSFKGVVHHMKAKAARPVDATNIVPLRTTARVFAENQAAMLGVSLSKAQKRRAIDRIEKVLKAKGITGAQRVPEPEPVPTPDPIPAMAPPQSLIDAGRRQAEADIAEQRKYISSGSVGSVFKGPANARPLGATVNAPVPPRSSNLSHACNYLEATISRLHEVVGTLSVQLTPILPQGFGLAPGDAPNPVEGTAALPNFLGSQAARIDGLVGLLNEVSSALSI